MWSVPSSLGMPAILPCPTAWSPRIIIPGGAQWADKTPKNLSRSSYFYYDQFIAPPQPLPSLPSPPPSRAPFLYHSGPIHFSYIPFPLTRRRQYGRHSSSYAAGGRRRYAPPLHRARADLKVTRLTCIPARTSRIPYPLSRHHPSPLRPTHFNGWNSAQFPPL